MTWEEELDALQPSDAPHSNSKLSVSEWEAVYRAKARGCTFDQIFEKLPPGRYHSVKVFQNAYYRYVKSKEKTNP